MIEIIYKNIRRIFIYEIKRLIYIQLHIGHGFPFRSVFSLLVRGNRIGEHEREGKFKISLGLSHDSYEGERKVTPTTSPPNEQQRDPLSLLDVFTMNPYLRACQCNIYVGRYCVAERVIGIFLSAIQRRVSHSLLLDSSLSIRDSSASFCPLPLLLSVPEISQGWLA